MDIDFEKVAQNDSYLNVNVMNKIDHNMLDGILNMLAEYLMRDLEDLNSIQGFEQAIVMKKKNILVVYEEIIKLSSHEKNSMHFSDCNYKDMIVQLIQFSSSIKRVERNLKEEFGK